MPKITDLDKNFKSVTDKNGLVYFDAFTAPVRISGLPWRETNGNYHRMDDRFSDEYNDGVRVLSSNTAGAQISFKTDSKRIGVKVDVEWNNLMPHMPYNSSTGIDIYAGSGREKKYRQTFFVYLNGAEHYEDVRELNFDTATEVTLNLPLYSGIASLQIGLEEDAVLEAPEPFDYKYPVLFYGSSITQGACASRPGLAYFHVLARKFNFEVVNMGFSGAALGEPVMARQIASIPLSAFVFDYDHNAPDAEHLKKTHKPFFDIVRRARPDLPIIMISKADASGGAELTKLRRDVIKATYDEAIASGDKNVWFVDGMKIYGEDAENSTVDTLHPNDIGFRHMAEAIAPALREALGE
ncbi:MAG: SGNH/GDSL hydrolase family protein [Clostridia bacterium]|nr:SGNH/GDSL hydrolase family protein [Clostridia bacterium]